MDRGIFIAIQGFLILMKVIGCVTISWALILIPSIIVLGIPAFFITLIILAILVSIILAIVSK